MVDICGLWKEVTLKCKAMFFFKKELGFCQRKGKRFNGKFRDEKRDFFVCLR